MGTYAYLDSWAYLPTYLFPSSRPSTYSQSVGAPRLGWWNATTLHQGKKKAMIIVHSSIILNPKTLPRQLGYCV